jgi:ER membrane protein complex subunit 1
MLLRILLALGSLLILPIFAVFLDDAFQLDYHYALLGYPQADTTCFQQPFPGSKASLVYTLSDRSVLAAINPKDGSIVWRQLLDPTTNSSVAMLRTGEDQDMLFSAVDGQIAAWNLADGRNIWSTNSRVSRVKDLEILDFEDGLSTTSVKDIVVLTEDSHPVVNRIDGRSGKVKWRYEDTRYISNFISHHKAYMYQRRLTLPSFCIGQ